VASALTKTLKGDRLWKTIWNPSRSSKQGNDLSLDRHSPWHSSSPSSICFRKVKKRENRAKRDSVSLLASQWSGEDVGSVMQRTPPFDRIRLISKMARSVSARWCKTPLMKTTSKESPTIGIA